MPQQQKQQSKHHKIYGPKMDSPRIAASKEHRNCNSLGYYHRACERGMGHIYTTRADWLGRNRRCQKRLLPR